MEDFSDPVIVEVEIPRPVQKVWECVSEKEHLKNWMFPEIEDFKAEIGFETNFSVQAETGYFLHQWRVIDVMPPKKMVLNWNYAGYHGDSTVTFELFDEKGKTLVRVVHQGVDSFPQDVPEFQRKSCENGWKYLLQESLLPYLKKL